MPIRGYRASGGNRTDHVWKMHLVVEMRVNCYPNFDRGIDWPMTKKNPRQGGLAGDILIGSGNNLSRNEASESFNIFHALIFDRDIF